MFFERFIRFFTVTSIFGTNINQCFKTNAFRRYMTRFDVNVGDRYRCFLIDAHSYTEYKQKQIENTEHMS